MVQYIGGCSVHWGNIMSTSGGVKYIGGYHDCIGEGNLMNTLGDIMSTLGDTMSTLRDVQYIRGYHEYIGGYHEYIGVFNRN